MANDLFFISDTHFGHANILNFKRTDGSPLRSFSSVEEMDDHMVDCWNRTVRPQDKVYHLGDVAFSDAGLKQVGRLNGHKRLVKGNHDLRKLRDYSQYFEEIYGARQFDGFWLTHIPMHSACVNQPRVNLNIHGHLHAGIITQPDGSPDPKYLNVGVELMFYSPISFDEIKAGLSNANVHRGH